jgi:hypothetical protein
MKALNTWIKPPSQTNMVSNFSNLVILVGKKIQKKSGNSKKNVNNKKIAKFLKSQM